MRKVFFLLLLIIRHIGLSAVDVQVGRAIFDHLVFISKSKVVILANHQLQYSAAATKISVLNDGLVIQHGSFNEVSKGGVSF